MKKYLSVLFMFALVFVFSLSFVSKVNAATSDCSFGVKYDSATGTDCKLVPTCVYSNINHLTGLPCATVKPNPSTTAKQDPSSILLSNSLQKVSPKSTGLNNLIWQAFFSELNLLADNYITGYNGSLTSKAAAKFQANSRLGSDGRIGPATIKAAQQIVATKDTNFVVNLLKKVKIVKQELDKKDKAKAKEKASSRPVVSCPANAVTTASVSAVATITARASYKLFKVTSASKLELITEDADGGEIPEEKLFNMGAGEKLLIVEFPDKNYPENAVLAEITYGGRSFVTNAGDWRSALTSINVPSNSWEVTNTTLEQEYNKSVWGQPVALSSNESDPYTRAISGKAEWITTSQNSEEKLRFYVTKGSGEEALRDCGSATARTCPYPYVGEEFDCKMPPGATIANTTPGHCGPSILTSIEGECTGVYPNINVKGTLKFGPARAAMVGLPDGMHLGIYPSDGSAPVVELVPVGNPNPSNIFNFFYQPVSSASMPPLSKFEGTIYPVPKYGWLNQPAGFYKNSIFPIDTSTLFAIAQAKIKCEPTPIELGISVTKVCDDGTIDAFVKFTGAVTVTGVPMIEVIKADGSKGITLNYVSGSGSDTLKFRYNVAANFVEADAIGKFAFKLPLTNASIKSGNVEVALAGEWAAPDSPSCTPPPPVVMCIAFDQGLGVNYNITFPEAVTVTGSDSDIRIKIVKTNGTEIFGNYTGQHTGDTMLSFMIAPGTQMTTLNDSVGTVTLLLSNGATVKNSAGVSVDTNIGVLASSSACAPTEYQGLIQVDTISVKEVTEVASTGGYNNGPKLKLQIKVKFKSSATGNPNAYVFGTPAIYLQKGNTTDYGAKAVYVEGSGTNTLTFEHTSSAQGYPADKYDLNVYDKLQMDPASGGTIHTLAPNGTSYWFANLTWFNNN